MEQVSYTEPVEGNARSLTAPARLGGARQLSAAQFVHDQADGMALVASPDGRFTIFKWSLCEEMVARASRGCAAAVEAAVCIRALDKGPKRG